MIEAVLVMFVLLLPLVGGALGEIDVDLLSPNGVPLLVRSLPLEGADLDELGLLMF